MAAPRDIRAAMKAALDTVPGCQVSAYALSSPTLPCLYILPGREMIVTYDVAMARGADEWQFRVIAMSGASDDIGSQMLMDEFLDPSGTRSVKAALESDPSLGGVVDDLHVTDARGYTQVLREGAGPMLVAEIDVQVIARGDD